MKTLNFKIEEDLLKEFKDTVKQFHGNASGIMRELIRDYIKEKQNDVYYKLTNYSETTQEEANEIMKELNSLTDEDLEMETMEVFEI